ncbi:MAG: ATP citrate lyase citrate-binding domain-containing protein [Patescibacteria group bacterium]
MPRQKITEYRAKKLLIGDGYKGIAVSSTTKGLPKSGRFVVKVDQGVKRRFKQGLVALDQKPGAIPKMLKGWQTRGFSQFLIEPYLVHKPSEERYLSLERVREGIRALFAGNGGIEIESHPKSIKKFVIKKPADVAVVAKQTKLPVPFLEHLIDVFDQNFFAFLEINPLVVRGNTVHLLDAAVMVDSAGAFFVRDGWSETDTASRVHHEAEERVQALAKTTPASLKLTVLNPNGSLFFLLSGGGGSIVIADQAALRGCGKEIGNYGEYSGGPTREETHLYAREVIQLLINSKAKKKTLIIAGGVANFTDVKATFAGIIDALREEAERLRKMKVKVFIRRGGPNEVEGLAEMKEFLKRAGLFGSVHGSEAVITAAVDDAIDYLKL